VASGSAKRGAGRCSSEESRVASGGAGKGAETGATRGRERDAWRYSGDSGAGRGAKTGVERGAKRDPRRYNGGGGAGRYSCGGVGSCSGGAGSGTGRAWLDEFQDTQVFDQGFQGVEALPRDGGEHGANEMEDVYQPNVCVFPKLTPVMRIHERVQQSAAHAIHVKPRVQLVLSDKPTIELVEGAMPPGVLQLLRTSHWEDVDQAVLTEHHAVLALEVCYEDVDVPVCWESQPFNNVDGLGELSKPLDTEYVQLVCVGINLPCWQEHASHSMVHSQVGRVIHVRYEVFTLVTPKIPAVLIRYTQTKVHNVATPAGFVEQDVVRLDVRVADLEALHDVHADKHVLQTHKNVLKGGSQFRLPSQRDAAVVHDDLIHLACGVSVSFYPIAVGDRHGCLGDRTDIVHFDGEVVVWVVFLHL